MLTGFENKTLLFLGGLALEIEALKKARANGIRTIVADYYEDAPAKQYCDVASMVSATDIDGLTRLCEREHVDGVFCGYSDALLPSYAKLCARLGVPCYGSEETFRIMVNKEQFKDVCRSFDVPVVCDYQIRDVEEGKADFPLLVKPTDATGSRGITVVKSQAEFGPAVESAISFSRSNNYLIEKYMSGAEAVLYYYIQDGNPVFQGMCDRYVFNNNDSVAQLPTAYVYPSIYTRNYIESRSDDRVRCMLKAIGMSNGPLFLQAFISDGLPVFYEPGYRLCGAREHVLVSALNGIDSEEMLIRFALTGKMHDLDIQTMSDPFFHGKFGCKLSPILKQGEIAQVIGLSEANDIDGVVNVFPNNKEGDVVSQSEVGTLLQLAYRAYITANTIPELATRLDEVQRTIDYIDCNGDSMILAGFDTNLLRH